MKHLSIAAALSLLMLASYSSAEEEWYQHSFGVHIGGVENAATIDARGTYKELEMGSDAELALSYSTVLKSGNDLEFRLSTITVRGTQYNASGSGNEGNALDINMDSKFIRMLYKWRLNKSRDMLVPWLAIGPNVGLIEVTEQEVVGTAYGELNKDDKNKVSTAFGVDLYAGFDLYFFKDSALALTSSVRYNYDIINGPFEGNINSAAFLVGLKWDFGQRRE
jgi:hypothetical protein